MWGFIPKGDYLLPIRGATRSVNPVLDTICQVPAIPTGCVFYQYLIWLAATLMPPRMRSLAFFVSRYSFRHLKRSLRYTSCDVWRLKPCINLIKRVYFGPVLKYWLRYSMVLKTLNAKWKLYSVRWLCNFYYCRLLLFCILLLNCRVDSSLV